jgi:hypothetical protein
MAVGHPQFGTFCSICFHGLTAATCAVDIDGQKWDLCKGQCARQAGVQEQLETTKTGTKMDLTEIDSAIAGAKARFDHADAPHHPDVLALIRAAEAARQDLAEMNALFELQWTRSREADARWRAEDPVARELVQPDLGVLLTWLMADADAARAEHGKLLTAVGQLYASADESGEPVSAEDLAEILTAAGHSDFAPEGAAMGPGWGRAPYPGESARKVT